MFFILQRNLKIEFGSPLALIQACIIYNRILSNLMTNGEYSCKTHLLLTTSDCVGARSEMALLRFSHRCRTSGPSTTYRGAMAKKQAQTW